MQNGNQIQRDILRLENEVRTRQRYTVGKILRKLLKIILPASFMELNRMFEGNVLVGYKLYERFVVEYGSNVKVLNNSFFTSDRKLYFMDYIGSGDIYCCCSYLAGKGLITDMDILIAPSSSVRKVASYFEFGDIVEISEQESFALRIMNRFLGKEIWIFPLLYESIPLIYSGILRHMQGHREIDFMAMLRIGMEINLGIIDDNGALFIPFELPYKKNEMDRIFSQYDLKPGHVAMLAPYVGPYMQDVLPMNFYYEIANRLKKKGFMVFTNSSDPIEEPPVPGTIPICLPYHLIAPFISGGGVFVGQRSGLCDIIAYARECTKIIMYPSKRIAEGVASWIDFFSLKKMGITQDIIEMEYQNDKTITSVISAINSSNEEKKYAMERKNQKNNQ